MRMRSLIKTLTKQYCYKCFKFWFKLSVSFLFELTLWLSQIDDFKASFALFKATRFPTHNFDISSLVANETSA